MVPPQPGATIAALSAGGLALMMLVGVVTRIRVLDSLAQTPPALVLMCLNLFIAWVALGPLGAATTTLGP